MNLFINMALDWPVGTILALIYYVVLVFCVRMFLVGYVKPLIPYEEEILEGHQWTEQN